MRTLLHFVGLMLLATTLPAQTKSAPQPPPILDLRALTPPELTTEGPDFTDSTHVVGTGVFQVESGFSLANEQGVRSFSGPETLIRIGLTERLELRLGSGGFQSDDSGGRAILRGWTDSQVAIKIRVYEQGRFRPAISLIPVLSVPTVGSSFSSGGFDPTVKLAWDKDLTRGFSIGGNFNMSSLRTPEGRFRQTAISASVGHKLTAGFDANWEVYQLSPYEKDGSPAWVASTGISRGVGQHADIEAQVGRRITNAGPDWFCGVSMAIRNPKRLWVHSN